MTQTSTFDAQNQVAPVSERAPAPSASVLHREVFAGSRITWWTLIYSGIILFVLFTRLWGLAGRGYSHDESIHAWEAWKLVTGQGYKHSPVYHGPFLYHFTALLFALFGHNDYTARLSPALFGIALVVLPLFLQRWLGKKGVLAAAFLMAISPVMMHRSRFLRHDPYAAVFNLILFIAIVYYLYRPRARYLYIASAAVALGFAAKETSFITYFIFGTALFALFVYDWLRDRSQALYKLPVFDLMVVIGTLILPLASPFAIRLLGGDPVDYTTSGIYFSGAVFLGVLAISVAIGVWWDWRRWVVCAAIFYGIFVPLFTTMFTNGQGFATGMVGQLGYWLSQQEVARGGQPWFYYLVLMPMYEFLPLLVGLAGAIYYIVRGNRVKTTVTAEAPDTAEVDDVVVPSVGAIEADGDADTDIVERRPQPTIPVMPMIIYWLVAAFVIYSWAGEKMPWLTMHLALPLHMLAGWTLGRLLDADWKGIVREKGLWLLLLVPLFVYALLKVGSYQPFASTDMDALNRSMAWGAALIVAILAAAGIARVASRLRGRDVWRMIALSLVIVLAALTVRFAWMATFINADLASEFLVYAQGAPDVAIVSEELEEMSRRLTGGLHMKVAYDDDSSWPFVWYLRNFTNAQFYGKKPAQPFDAEAVIVGPANEAAVKPFLGNRYYRRQYRMIWWPNQDWYMSMTVPKLLETLRDPALRQQFWDVIFYREHEAELTSWPYVHNFALYIRRDIAQQLWDYGPEVLMAEGELPGDEYVEKWSIRQADAVWGSQGGAPGQFNEPKGLAVDADGNVYVADSRNHRIQMLDANGQFVRQWGGEGNAPGQFNEPWGVAVGPEGNIYVADTWNHRVQVFDPEGNLLRAWGMFGEVDQPTGPGNVLYGPRDLAFDDAGNLYLTDTGNKRVVKYDASGQMLGAVGGPGAELGLFQEPVGLAVGPDGNVYVADTWNQRIQIFDRDLNPVESWDVLAWDGMSVVNKPYLAVDDEGHVYATDPEGYRVLEFDGDGELVRSWGQFGADVSSMNLPTGLAVDRDQRLLVSDAGNHRVLVFQ